MLQQATSEMEILGPGKDDRVRMPATGAQGIKAQLAHSSNENLVYELRVPLKSGTDQPYAIGSDTGKAIGIGFEVAETDRGSMQRGAGGEEGRPRGGRGGGGGGGGRRGRSSGGEGASPESGSGSHETFNLWIHAALAGMPAVVNK